jgi:hypothetical protein
VILRLFKDISREVEAFDYKCKAFIKITRLFGEIFREMEAFSTITSLFKDIFNGIEAFFNVIRGLFIKFETFFELFPIMEVFFS